MRVGKEAGGWASFLLPELSVHLACRAPGAAAANQVTFLRSLGPSFPACLWARPSQTRKLRSRRRTQLPTSPKSGRGWGWGLTRSP